MISSDPNINLRYGSSILHHIEGLHKTWDCSLTIILKSAAGNVAGIDTGCLFALGFTGQAVLAGGGTCLSKKTSYEIGRIRVADHLANLLYAVTRFF